MKERFSKDLVRSIRTLPDKELRLVSFECNFPDCEWSLSASATPYHKALREFGFHNLEAHEGTSAQTIVNVYRKVARSTPDPR